jgi:hypothetical protein
MVWLECMVYCWFHAQLVTATYRCCEPRFRELSEWEYCRDCDVPEGMDW